MLLLQVFPDFGGSDDFPDVEGHFEQVGGVLAVEGGVEYVLLFGLFQSFDQNQAFFALIFLPAISGAMGAEP